MEAGHLLVLPPETLHCELYERGVWPRVGWIGATIPGIVPRPEILCRAIPVNPDQLVELERILTALSQEKTMRASGWREVIDLELRRLFLLLDRWAAGIERSEVADDDRREPLPARTRETLQAAADWMAAHCAEPIRVADVAARYHFSTTHFSALFRKGIGVAPKKYLLSARLARARWLIERGELTHAAIAQECGFYDEAHFHRVFKQYIGHAPGREMPRG